MVPPGALGLSKVSWTLIGAQSRVPLRDGTLTQLPRLEGAWRADVPQPPAGLPSPERPE
jgi:hypothetical protein